jgi:hypothetical protein
MDDVLHINEHRESVRAHQSHLNDRLRARGELPIAVTGTCDAATIRATAFAAWFLGALEETARRILAGTIGAGSSR